MFISILTSQNVAQQMNHKLFHKKKLKNHPNRSSPKKSDRIKLIAIVTKKPPDLFFNGRRLRLQNENE